jgi:hypothetical protein
MTGVQQSCMSLGTDSCLSFKPVDPYLGLHLAYRHAVFQRSPVILHINLMPANYTQS